MKTGLAKIGNKLYHHSPAFYGAAYSIYKAISDRSARRFIASIVHEGMTALDVGANIGAYTRFFANVVGPSGRVVAIEPEAENYKRLLAAIRDLSNVETHRAAVAEKSGQCFLYKSDSLNVDHRTYDSGESREREVVAAIALDDLIPPGNPVHFIKMDIQGAELGAIRGAKRILGENRNIGLLFEYWPYAIERGGGSPQALLDLLQADGFRLNVLGKPLDASRGTDDYWNILARR